MADFTTCISSSSMRKLRSPNQNTTLWKKESFHESASTYVPFQCWQWHHFPCKTSILRKSGICRGYILFYCLSDRYIKLYMCLYLCVCACVCVLTYSWSRTPVADWPSNCCCCRMLSKSSMRWSEFSMWAGRWQFRKQMVWPKTDMRALTPPLFPCNTDKQRGSKIIFKRWRHAVERGRRLLYCIILFVFTLEAKLNEWMN